MLQYILYKDNVLFRHPDSYNLTVKVYEKKSIDNIDEWQFVQNKICQPLFLRRSLV